MYAPPDKRPKLIWREGGRGGMACKSAAGCVDARAPVRTSSYINLHRWAESDAEFVRSVINGEKETRRRYGPSPRVVDSYSCRQMYLRSYTFSKKESVPEKTRKCLGKVRERAAEFPFIAHHRKDSGASSVASFDSGSVKSVKTGRGESNRSSSGKSKKRRKKKGCSTVKKLSNAISSIFRRLLSCTTTVDVVDGRSPA